MLTNVTIKMPSIINYLNYNTKKTDLPDRSDGKVIKSSRAKRTEKYVKPTSNYRGPGDRRPRHGRRAPGDRVVYDHDRVAARIIGNASARVHPKDKFTGISLIEEEDEEYVLCEADWIEIARKVDAMFNWYE